ncbi:MAG: BRCT domain-containing protein, partial [Myxococcota bacterium]
ALTAMGGVVARSVGPKTDFLIAGSAPGKSKLRKARTLGIPVLDADQLAALLSGSEVEVDGEVVTSGDASVRDLIGEARATLDGQPTSEVWSSLVAIVDSCAPEQLPALVDFIALEPSFGFLAPVFAANRIYERFEGPDGTARDVSVLGLDAGLKVAFVLPVGLEARVGGAYVRYFSSFSPEPGDVFVAGGALDQYVVLRAALAYRY